MAGRTCERYCDWNGSEKFHHCPEFDARITRRWCELARTKARYYRLFSEAQVLKSLPRPVGSRRRNPPPMPSAEVIEAAKSLGIVNLTARWVMAITRWVNAGRPVRPPEEIRRIYEECCKPCRYFKNDRCRACGCRVSTSGWSMSNKIKMATELCPRWTPYV